MSKDNSKKTRERRHNDAVARQAEYDKLSFFAKVKKAVAAPGDSKRELDRFRAEDGYSLVA